MSDVSLTNPCAEIVLPYYDDVVFSHDDVVFPFMSIDTDILDIMRNTTRYVPCVSKSIEEAKKRNQDVVFATANEIFVDIDDMDSLKGFRDRLITLMKYIDIAGVTYTRSRNNGWHFYVKANQDLGWPDIVGFSAMLGSDPDYVCCAACRIWNSEPDPFLFFEKKDAVRKVYDWTSPPDDLFDIGACEIENVRVIDLGG
jgi:hypothetical protein